MLAALEDDESLSAQLGGPAQPRSKAPDITAPPGAYLQSLTVTGFRGIGPPATLKVTPRPGLTLVVGRNGSGKSSSAEALEVLLTDPRGRQGYCPGEPRLSAVPGQCVAGS